MNTLAKITQLKELDARIATEQKSNTDALKLVETALDEKIVAIRTEYQAIAQKFADLMKPLYEEKAALEKEIFGVSDGQALMLSQLYDLVDTIIKISFSSDAFVRGTPDQINIEQKSEEIINDSDQNNSNQ